MQIQCKGITKRGDRCKKNAQPDSEFCLLHDINRLSDRTKLKVNTIATLAVTILSILGSLLIAFLTAPDPGVEIVSVAPSQVKAGATLEIHGQHFEDAVKRCLLIPKDRNHKSIMFDKLSAIDESVTLQVPVDAAVGDYELLVSGTTGYVAWSDPINILSPVLPTESVSFAGIYYPPEDQADVKAMAQALSSRLEDFLHERCDSLVTDGTVTETWREAKEIYSDRSKYLIWAAVESRGAVTEVRLRLGNNATDSSTAHSVTLAYPNAGLAADLCMTPICKELNWSLRTPDYLSSVIRYLKVRLQWEDSPDKEDKQLGRTLDAARVDAESLDQGDRQRAFEYLFLSPNGLQSLEEEGFEPSWANHRLQWILFDTPNAVSRRSLSTAVLRATKQNSFYLLKRMNWLGLIQVAKEAKLAIEIIDSALEVGDIELAWSAAGHAATFKKEVTATEIARRLPQMMDNSEHLFDGDKLTWELSMIANAFYDTGTSLPAETHEPLLKLYKKIESEFEHYEGGLQVLNQGLTRRRSMAKDLMALLSTTMDEEFIRTYARIDNPSIVWTILVSKSLGKEKIWTLETIANALKSDISKQQKYKEMLSNLVDPEKIAARGKEDIFVAFNKEVDAIRCLVGYYRDREAQDALLSLAEVKNPGYASWACSIIESQVLRSSVMHSRDSSWWWMSDEETEEDYWKRIKDHTSSVVARYYSALDQSELIYDENTGWYRLSLLD